MIAARLRALHVPGDPLLLPNAWDAASARLVAKAGFPVVATGSAAMAAALGYADGHGTPPGEMFAAIRRLAEAVDVPVTADIEGGYGLGPAELAERLAEAGAVGCNLEDTAHPGDGLVAVAEQADRVAALRAADGDLVINARVDVFLRAADQRAVLAEGIERARAYLAAGADCVYPILIRDEEVLGEFVEAVRPAAVNAAYLPGGPSLAAMRAAGMARISLGPGLFHLTQNYLEKVLTGLAAGKSPY
ncbi:isocitrate lyase/PEP mutase family protein [Actinophytocola sediminis]